MGDDRQAASEMIGMFDDGDDSYVRVLGCTFGKKILHGWQGPLLGVSTLPFAAF